MKPSGKLLGHGLTDAAQPDLLPRSVRPAMHDPSLRQVSPLRHDDQREPLALRFPLENLSTDVLEAPGNLRQEDHIAAAGDSRVERDPAGMAAHHLQHHDPLMAGGGGVEPVEGVGCGSHRGIKAKREGRHGSLSIVLGTPTTGIPRSWNCWAIASEPSPPAQIRPQSDSCRTVAST